ncbi:two component transcriptional regulator, LytTR family [Flagellimonas taeanensis]|uniref:Two component transcriptional regulator, LytTR family n=1 Tax=Flagellimonas taeanensis TaxID=1005926 RepID=A0A1M6TLQ7_9FLAO|nr:LytTR family DNA-binding domain-containing protein [Allomuricauda taeanensis]MEE1962247.1 LytTR family DNA-binding domain-containing protein [Allomuricauda taeanensis]SFB89042.1 two component transcriptional regulator, LytTR family [Allomuricauda taeanensis]SHK57708.1 two component transcriptional regulator, LytTR family [Allomuricauda taeanensis]
MAKKLKCIIVDDEPLAREVLQEYVQVIDHLELVCTVENALELDQMLEKQAIDLIFLDIQMPYLTGLDFLKVRHDLPMVIITTAFPNYALDGFRFDVIDYLLKPITFNRFFKAVTKAVRYHSFKLGTKEPTEAAPEQPYFFVKCDGRYQKIYTSEILFVKALENYVLIHTTSDKHMSLMPLKTIEENLDTEAFIRVHKSYIVPISKIRSLENHELILEEGHKIPVSRNYAKQVQDKVLKDRVLKRKEP